jgi:hypothetical protein
MDDFMRCLVSEIRAQLPKHTLVWHGKVSEIRLRRNDSQSHNPALKQQVSLGHDPVFELFPSYYGLSDRWIDTGPSKPAGSNGESGL